MIPHIPDAEQAMQALLHLREKKVLRAVGRIQAVVGAEFNAWELLLEFQQKHGDEWRLVVQDIYDGVLGAPREEMKFVSFFRIVRIRVGRVNAGYLPDLRE